MGGESSAFRESGALRLSRRAARLGPRGPPSATPARAGGTGPGEPLAARPPSPPGRRRDRSGSSSTRATSGFSPRLPSAPAALNPPRRPFSLCRCSGSLLPRAALTSGAAAMWLSAPAVVPWHRPAPSELVLPAAVAGAAVETPIGRRLGGVVRAPGRCPRSGGRWCHRCDHRRSIDWSVNQSLTDGGYPVVWDSPRSDVFRGDVCVRRIGGSFRSKTRRSGRAAGLAGTLHDVVVEVCSQLEASEGTAR
jgi:hypothetical protein